MDGFEAIYIKYFDNVYKYVFSLCQNETVAEEITQEAFYKALKSLSKFEGKCSLYVWLCQIAKNTFYTYAKKQKRFVSGTDGEPSVTLQQNMESEFLDKETAYELYNSMNRLRNPYKEVFSLRVFGELPFSQIGELFGKSDSWARLIFYRAKKEIRRDFDENNM